jgi:hypothetical protein
MRGTLVTVPPPRARIPRLLDAAVAARPALQLRDASTYWWM